MDICERKRAQKEKEFQAKMLNATGDAIIAVDIPGNVIFWNEAATRAFGWTRSEAMGRNLTELIVPQFSKEQAAEISPRLRRGESWKGEFLVQKKDGTVFPVEVTDTPIFDKQGNLAGIIGVSRDIIERKKIEGQLARQSSFLNTVMENTGAMLAYLDRDFNFIIANKAYINACGHTWDELKGKNHFSYFPNEENERIFRQVRDTGEAVTFHDKPFEFADQPWRGVTYWDWTLVPVKDSSNQVAGLVFSLIETTQHKEMEIKLEHLASFPELNPQPVLELDESGKAAYLNPASRALFPELEKQRAAHPFLADWEILVKKLQNGKPPIITRDIQFEQRWYEQMVMYLPSRKTYRVYAIDITERKRAEQMKDEFLSLVSHELRTPLTVIGGSLKVAMDKAVPPEEVHELLQGASENADLLAEILENMLELTRHQAGRLRVKIEPVDSRQMLNKVIDKIKASRTTHHFQVEMPERLPRIQADPLRLERILHNLLDNAVKYSPEESEITVRAQADTHFLVTSIIDNGRGISKEDQEGLFELFYRGSNPDTTSGIGLGLVVCRRLLEAHGGWIRVESEPGKGSTFSFGLPLHQLKT